MRLRRLASQLLALFCGAVQPAWASDDPPARSGMLRLLTYNVAGLPEGLSAVHPVRTLPQVGALLHRYDVALIQEDYAYPALLRQKLRLPYSSPAFVRGQALHFGDGLSQFGKLAFSPTQRMAWRHCHGIVDSYFDCLTPKGLAMVRAKLGPGIFVDFYNVHLDAGPELRDQEARALQLEQLAAAITSMSGNRAVIVGGDFNLTPSELPLLGALGHRLRLRDACTELRCREPWRIDRVLVRSSASLSLTPRSWNVDPAFRDALGRPLSDHLAVSVVVRWAETESSDAGTVNGAGRHRRAPGADRAP